MLGTCVALYVDSLQNRVRKRSSAGLWQVEEVSSRAHRYGGRARHEGAPDLLRTSHIQNPHAPSTSTHVLARMLIVLVLLLPADMDTGHAAHQATFPHAPKTYLGGT